MPNRNTNNTSMKTVVYKSYALCKRLESEEGPSAHESLTDVGKLTQVWLYIYI